MFSLFPFLTNMSTKNCISSLVYFSEHIMYARCRKPLKTLLVILGSIHEFGLIVCSDCVLSIYFEFVFFISSIVGDFNV